MEIKAIYNLDGTPIDYANAPSKADARAAQISAIKEAALRRKIADDDGNGGRQF
jgi:hypothetical protein